MTTPANPLAGAEAAVADLLGRLRLGVGAQEVGTVLDWLDSLGVLDEVDTAQSAKPAPVLDWLDSVLDEVDTAQSAKPAPEPVPTDAPPADVVPAAPVSEVAAVDAPTGEVVPAAASPIEPTAGDVIHLPAPESDTVPDVPTPAPVVPPAPTEPIPAPVEAVGGPVVPTPAEPEHAAPSPLARLADLLTEAGSIAREMVAKI